MIDYIRETWEEMHPALRRIIIAELAILTLLLLLLAITSAARAETYTCVVHKGEWVWIRSGASYEATQIGQIRYGYEVDVDSIEQGWAHIRFKDTEGFVDASYLERDIPETMYRVICEGKVAKRETPAGRLLCWIKPGSKISVLGWRYDKSGNLWAKVYKGGYVSAAFLGEM